MISGNATRNYSITLTPIKPLKREGAPTTQENGNHLVSNNFLDIIIIITLGGESSL